jgi:nucleotide-binding universal stress UspA family protein
MKDGRMINIHVVLHPTDFSEISERALPYAIEFAHRYGARLVLLHVLDLPFSAISMAEEAIVDAQDKLDAMIPGKHRDRLDLVALVKRGDPCEEICRIAREQRADIIIIGTHGSGGWRHAILGDTAEKVVRHAPCPVLTIRDPEHGFVDGDGDESETSEDE